jgi:hypothetical protein
MTTDLKILPNQLYLALGNEVTEKGVECDFVLEGKEAQLLFVIATMARRHPELKRLLIRAIAESELLEDDV